MSKSPPSSINSTCAAAPSAALDLILNRSAELRAAGWFAEALAMLNTSGLPIVPAVAAARSQLLNDLGRFHEAIEVATQALDADSSQHDARFAQAFALTMLERQLEAEQTLNTLITLEPNYPNAVWLRAGLLRQLRGELDPDALAAYDLTVTVDPANLYARVERADLLRANGRYAEALTDYTEVCASTPDEALFVEATFKRGCVALVLNDTAAARTAFHTVLAHAPDYPAAQEMVGLLT